MCCKLGEAQLGSAVATKSHRQSAQGLRKPRRANAIEQVEARAGRLTERCDLGIPSAGSITYDYEVTQLRLWRGGELEQSLGAMSQLDSISCERETSLSYRFGCPQSLVECGPL